jgi:ribosome-associated protein
VPDAVSQVRPDAEETLRVILASLDDAKAEDTITIDLHGKTSIGDYMVVTCGRSNRHVGAVADRVREDLKQAGVIIHVFRPEVRAFYNLEKMWAPGRASTRRAS